MGPQPALSPSSAQKTDPGRKIISLQAGEAGPEVSEQELLCESGAMEIPSLGELMQVFRAGLVKIKPR